MARQIQPMGLVGSREEIRAPTSVKARITTSKMTAYFAVPQPPVARVVALLRKSRTTLAASSAKHNKHNDHARRETVRALGPPTSRPCCLAPDVTMPHSTGSPSTKRYGTRYERENPVRIFENTSLPRTPVNKGESKDQSAMSRPSCI
jgi:hypothetical protein